LVDHIGDRGRGNSGAFGNIADGGHVLHATLSVKRLTDANIEVIQSRVKLAQTDPEAPAGRLSFPKSWMQKIFVVDT
jgi:hypothetical protein